MSSYKEQAQKLIGSILIEWGEAMGKVYMLPKSLEIEGASEVSYMLAAMNGDGSRIEHLAKLLKMTTPRAAMKPEVPSLAVSTLGKLGKLSTRRDNFAHGIPSYLPSQRKWVLLLPRKNNLAMDLKDEGEAFLEELRPIQETLTALSMALTYEQWDELTFGGML